ncbi:MULTISPECIES: fibronectin type III domain-containing protein [unclassified Pseudofrankia]|uniref:fibronectin type III domain-containing protein n=1 Tax=unclassified Pseudofrankia TaxID=2994372 RepID=UPI0008D8FEB3|nr:MULTISPECIES: fibronectin type III domain-containing protein [unclassified Pseudofrankia]MDT3442443.1 fibronectin type III domain-containing protein [Pseudofrankia sp. BMG5.37]OHV48977.1 hypothetical protein BCD48_14145 [Pseudofrankia sp. BMG5.36]
MSETQSEATTIADAAAGDLDSASTGQDTAQEEPAAAEAVTPGGESAQTDADVAGAVSAKAVVAEAEPVLADGASPVVDDAEVPAPSEDLATDLSGLEPIAAWQGSGSSPPFAGRRGPRRGTAWFASGRSKRPVLPVPAIITLVVLVTLAGVTVPLALRTADRNAYLTSSGPDVTDGGATVAAPPGRAEDAAGGSVTLPGQSSARSGQSPPSTGATVRGSGTSPSGGGTRQPNGPGTQQPGGNGGSDGSGVGANPQSNAGAPAPQVPGAPGMQARPVPGGVEVTITEPTGGGIASSYVVTADPGGTTSLSAPGTVTIQVDSCAQTAVSARATNAAGTSAAASRTLVGCVAPSVPRNVTLTKLPPQASDPTGHNLVSWTAPTETGGTGVAVDYIVRVYISSENVTSVSSYTVTGTSYLRSNASGRDPYIKITVAARNPAGESAEVVVYRGSGPTDVTSVTPLTPGPPEA